MKIGFGLYFEIPYVHWPATSRISITFFELHLETERNARASFVTQELVIYVALHPPNTTSLSKLMKPKTVTDAYFSSSVDRIDGGSCGRIGGRSCRYGRISPSA